MRQRMRRIDYFKKNPFQTQKNQLSYLLQTAKNTEFGELYRFGKIKIEKEFQQQIPLQSYESLLPYIERNLKGEQNLLWPGIVNWFAKSSGTTDNKSKFIPITKDNLFNCHYQAGKDILALYCNQFHDARIFNGRSLTMGGSHEINPLNKNSYIGDLSAILIDNLPFWVRQMRSPKKEITFLGDWEEKLNKMADETIHQNITSISGVPSWTSIFFQKVLEKTGKENIEKVWPNLEMYIHGGVNFMPYTDQYKKFFPGNKLRYIEIYNASEGFFGIQPEDNVKDLLLMLDYCIFYEFIPLEEFEKENPKTLLLEEVEINKSYALVITTNSGLWRYQLGDTITFTSVDPHKFIISGRTKHFINAFGEELMVGNTDKAIAIAAEKCKVNVIDYTAAPKFFAEGHCGVHEWLIEFDDAPSDLTLFTYCLDNALKSLNSDYETKRYLNLILKQPEISIVKKGTFYEWLKSKNKLGGQNKIPRLSNDRELIEELIQYIQK